MGINVEMFEKVCCFDLTKEELASLTEQLEETIEDFDFEGFDRYFDYQTLLKAFDLNKKKRIGKEYLKNWLCCYSRILAINEDSKNKFSIVDEIKDSIVTAIYDYGDLDDDEDPVKMFKEEQGFMTFALHLMDLVKSKSDLMITCMIDRTDLKMQRIIYLVVDKESKKYYCWESPLLVERALIAEPIISAMKFKKKLTELKSLEYQEF